MAKKHAKSRAVMTPEKEVHKSVKALLSLIISSGNKRQSDEAMRLRRNMFKKY